MYQFSSSFVVIIFILLLARKNKHVFFFKYSGWECSYNCSKCIASCCFCRFGGIGFDGYCTTKKVTFLWPQFAFFRTQDLKLKLYVFLMIFSNINDICHNNNIMLVKKFFLKDQKTQFNKNYGFVFLYMVRSRFKFVLTSVMTFEAQFVARWGF